MADMKSVLLNILQKLHLNNVGEAEPQVKQGYFSILLNILILTGIDLEPIRNKYCNFIYRIYSVFMVTLMIVFAVTELVQLMFFTTELYVLTFGLCYFFTHILGMFKYLLILIKRKRIYLYIRRMETGLFKPSMSRGGRVEFGFVQNAINGFTTQGLVFCSFAICVLSCRSASVLLDEGYDVIASDDNATIVVHEKMLPFTSWSPFEQNRSPWYYVIFVYQLTAIFSYAFSIGTIDAIICGFFMLIKAQFLIIGHGLQNVVENNDGILVLDEAKQKRAENLAKNCAIHHQALVEFCKIVEDTFCYVILMQFLSSLLILCLSLFQLSIMDNPLSFEGISMALYLSNMCFELFTFCYHANEAYLASNKVTFWAYQMDWWVVDERVKKILLMIMMRSQKPCIFTAGNFAVLSLETFVKIVKGSASYCMALQQVSDSTK